MCCLYDFPDNRFICKISSAISARSSFGISVHLFVSLLFGVIASLNQIFCNLHINKCVTRLSIFVFYAFAQRKYDVFVTI